jgi:hypothetical protein
VLSVTAARLVAFFVFDVMGRLRLRLSPSQSPSLSSALRFVAILLSGEMLSFVEGSWVRGEKNSRGLGRTIDGEC